MPIADVKIKVLKDFDGGRAGDIVEVGPHRADWLIANGFASSLKKKPAKKVAKKAAKK